MSDTFSSNVSRYVADDGAIHNIRVSDAVLALQIGGTAVTPTTDAVTSKFWAQVNKPARRYGLKARSIGIRYTGTPPAGLEANTVYNVPVLVATAFTGASIGDAVTYQGVAGEIAVKREEQLFPGS